MYSFAFIALMYYILKKDFGCGKKMRIQEERILIELLINQEKYPAEEALVGPIDRFLPDIISNKITPNANTYVSS